MFRKAPVAFWNEETNQENFNPFSLFLLFCSRTTDYQEECPGKAHLRLCYCRLLSFAVTSRGLQHACSMNVHVSQYAKWLFNALTSLKYKVFTQFSQVY